MTEALIAAMAVVVVAAVATRGRRYDLRSRAEKLRVIRSAGEGKRYGLDMDFGSRVRLIQRVDGVVRLDPRRSNAIIFEEPGMRPDSVPLARIHAIYRGGECLGRW
jgi:hypothetical protein